MSRQITPFRKFIKLLEELHKDYPDYNIGRHFCTAFDGYGDLWGVSDQEIAFALEKYKRQLESDYFPDVDIDKIIEDGKNLDKFFINPLDEEDGYEEE
jgi:hypothetical protein